MLVADGCSSRTSLDKELALGRLRAAGVIVTSHEALLFQVASPPLGFFVIGYHPGQWFQRIGKKEHPAFKEISGLVRDLLHAPASPKL